MTPTPLDIENELGHPLDNDQCLATNMLSKYAELSSQENSKTFYHDT